MVTTPIPIDKPRCHDHYVVRRPAMGGTHLFSFSEASGAVDALDALHDLSPLSGATLSRKPDCQCSRWTLAAYP